MAGSEEIDFLTSDLVARCRHIAPEARCREILVHCRRLFSEGVDFETVLEVERRTMARLGIDAAYYFGH